MITLHLKNIIQITNFSPSVNFADLAQLPQISQLIKPKCSTPPMQQNLPAPLAHFANRVWRVPIKFFS